MNIMRKWSPQYFVDVIGEQIGLDIPVNVSKMSDIYEFRYTIIGQGYKLEDMGFTFKYGAYTIYISKTEWDYGICVTCCPTKIAMSQGSQNPYGVKLISDVYIGKDKMFAVLKVNKMNRYDVKEGISIDKIRKVNEILTNAQDYFDDTLYMVLGRLKVKESDHRVYSDLCQEIQRIQMDTPEEVSTIFRYVRIMIADIVEFLEKNQEHLSKIEFTIRSDFRVDNAMYDYDGNEIIPYDCVNFTYRFF